MDLANNQVWWSGPEFLQKNADSWLDIPTIWYSLSRVSENSFSSDPFSCVYTLSAGKAVSLKLISQDTYGPNLRLLSLVLKFIALLKSSDDDQSRCAVTWRCIDYSRRQVVMHVYTETFTEEYQQLLCVRPVMYRGQLSLALNEKKPICCKGHLGQTNFPCHMNSPVLLPTKHYFTNILILDQHKRFTTMALPIP